MCSALGNVRFGPIADSCTASNFVVIRSPGRRGQATEAVGKAEGLGGFQIDDQLDLGGLLNLQIGRLLPLENPAGVYPEQTIRLREIGSVAHETAGDRKLAVRIYRWHCMACRQLDEPITLGQRKYFSAYHKCTCPLTNQGLEG